MEELIDLDGMRGFEATLTGSRPYFVTVFTPCGRSEQKRVNAKDGDSEGLVRVFAKQDAKSLAAGHAATCEQCRSSEDAAEE